MALAHQRPPVGEFPRSIAGSRFPWSPDRRPPSPGPGTSHPPGRPRVVSEVRVLTMKRSLTILAALGLLLSAAPAATPEPVPAAAVTLAAASASGSSVSLERGWVATKTNNLCGLRDLGQLSNPAKLNYKRCLDATPEMKKIKADGIKLESPEGIQLSNAAATRVSTAANTLRKAGGFCSVWKAIKHTDGRTVSDITARVISQY